MMSHHHEHPSNHEIRTASNRALKAALIILSLFFVVEIVGGILTNSLALISDAAHLLTDVAAVILALLAQWFAQKDPSARRSFGYRRVEILAALLNGFTLLLVAIYIGYEAYGRIQDPPPVLGLPMIIVASLGLLAQTLAALILSRAQGESLNVRGAYLHAMTDAVQSIGVVVAGVVMLSTGWYLADPLISILIGLLVAYSGGKIIFEATHVLLEGTPKDINLDQIAAMIEQTPGVQRVTDLHAWTLTTGYNALSAHVVAMPNPEDMGHQRLLKRLTCDLRDDFPLQHITLQIEQECDLCQGSPCGEWLANGSAQPSEE